MTTETISFFDERGRITSNLTMDPAGIQANKDHFPGRWVEGDWYGKDVYVANGAVHPRPENPAQLHGMSLTHLPTPGTIHIDNASYPYDDATVELEFEHPGTYKVRVESWPYLDKEFEIENPPR